MKGIAGELVAAGAIPRFLASRLGATTGREGDRIDIDGTLESLLSVLFDAVILPDGVDVSLGKDGRTLEFLKDQYRHCKPILVLGSASTLIQDARIPTALPSGEPDPGLVIGAADDSASLAAFMSALAMHRHFLRETDPPLV